MSDAHKPARWGGGSGKKSVQANRPTASAEPAPPEPANDGPDATDAAKALAAEHGADLTAITGTGLDGRITKEDVLAYLEPPKPADEPYEPIPDEADTPVEEAQPAEQA